MSFRGTDYSINTLRVYTSFFLETAWRLLEKGLCSKGPTTFILENFDSDVVIRLDHTNNTMNFALGGTIPVEVRGQHPTHVLDNTMN